MSGVEGVLALVCLIGGGCFFILAIAALELALALLALAAGGLRWGADQAERGLDRLVLFARRRGGARR